MKSLSVAAGCRRIAGALAVAALAAGHGAVPARAERLPLRTYTVVDGLGQDLVRCLVADQRGFMWACTAGGLSRFDGYSFVNFGPREGLPDPQVTAMVASHDGTYWLGTSAGVCHFDPAGEPRFRLIPLGTSFRTNRVLGLFEDSVGRLWIGTGDGVFVRTPAPGGEEIHRMPLDSPGAGAYVEARSFTEWSDGTIFAATSHGLKRWLPGGRRIDLTIRGSEGAGRIRSVYADRHGHLWIACRDAGVVAYVPLHASTSEVTTETVVVPTTVGSGVRSSVELGDLQPGRAVRYAVGDGGRSVDVWSILETSDGRLWLAATGGLAAFDGRSFRIHTTSQGLASDDVRVLAEDAAGNLWIGSEGFGVMRLARDGFISYDEADGLGGTRIRSLFETSGGDLVAVAASPREVMLNRFDGRRFVAIRPNYGRALANYGWGWHQGVLQDHAGEWWVPTGEGLFRFPALARVESLADARPKAIYTTRSGLAGDEVFRLFEDSRGNVWIGTIYPVRSGLGRWDRATGRIVDCTRAPGLPKEAAPMAFREDRSGTVWIGFYGGGLAAYRDGRFSMPAGDWSAYGHIKDLFLDSAGRLWAATAKGGARRLDSPATDPSRVTALTVEQGLASNEVQAFAEDRQGRIYVSTPLGIDRLESGSGRIRHYTTAEGLAGSQIQVAYRDRHGSLWFGTLNGLSRFTPESEAASRQVPPPVFITALPGISLPSRLHDNGAREVSGIELEATHNRVHIEYLGVSLAPGERLRYQVRLDGPDRDWNPPTTDRSVTYASLSPGQYRFAVRALAASGLVSDHPATVTLTVLQPLWLRPWVLALAAATLGATGCAAYRIRLRAAVGIERVRSRIATDLHDDIGASLSRMAILGEAVKLRLGPQDEDADRFLTQITETARGLVDEMSDIVWSTDPRRDDLASLVVRVRAFASDLLDARGVHWRFDAPGGTAGALAPEVRRGIYLVLKEAITNAARHSGCTRLTIELTVADRELAADVCDDGAGWNPQSDPASSVRGGNGLANMRARAARLGGTLDIVAAPGAGTRVTLRVPLAHRRGSRRRLRGRDAEDTSQDT